MSMRPPRVVFDTVVFVQALISGRGSAAGCIERLRSGLCLLLLSEAILSEMNDVPLRPELTRKYKQLTPERVKGFVNEMRSLAAVIASPPRVFELPRDPKDEPLIDLAVEGQAEFLVTWNAKHLTYLMEADTPEGKEFCSRFPTLAIVDPPTFLTRLNSRVPQA